MIRHPAKTTHIPTFAGADSGSPQPQSAVTSAVSSKGSDRIIGYADDMSILRYARISPRQ